MHRVVKLFTVVVSVAALAALGAAGAAPWMWG